MPQVPRYVFALRPFGYVDSTGRKCFAATGTQLDLETVPPARRRRLLAGAKPLVGDAMDLKAHASQVRLAVIAPAPARARTRRIGIWLVTSPYYSGGRIMMYGYAVAMAQLGAEVFLFTNRRPPWAGNYPNLPNLKVVLSEEAIEPLDLDLIVTDSKGEMGTLAWATSRQYARARFVCISFETANWVRELAPDYAKLFDERQAREFFPLADMIVSISREGRKYLYSWLYNEEQPAPTVGDAVPACEYLYPPINALDLAPERDPAAPADGRPYALWCARESRYKGGMAAVEAVFTCPTPLDLIAIGNQPGQHDYTRHRCTRLGQVDDRRKFTLMRDAHMVIAPSTFEGFGLVPGEALSMGTPCVCYDLPVLREAYGTMLEYVPRGDVAALSARVHQLAAEPKRNLAAAARAVRQEYGLENFGRRCERLPYHAVSRARVTALMSVYACPVAQYALESIYEHVDSIVVSYGPVKGWQGWPDKGLREELFAFPDPERKIHFYVRDEWENKEEMRETACRRREVRGNYVLILDGDEIWTGLDGWVVNPPFAGSPRWVNLWHGGGHWIHGGNERWGERVSPWGSVCPHYRFSWWRPSYRWQNHLWPLDAEGNPVYDRHDSVRAAAERAATVIYHLGHCFPRAYMEQKHRFYARRDGVEATAPFAAQWRDWDGGPGRTGDGTVEAVTWPLPTPVVRALGRLEAAGADDSRSSEV